MGQRRPDADREIAPGRRRLRILALGVLALSAGAPTAARSQALDPASPTTALRDFGRICDPAGRRLWGLSLCGPVLLVDPASRRVVASDSATGLARERDAWVGPAPRETGFANMAVEWDGRRWTMVLLPLPADGFDRLQLLAHEAFHRVQPDLGLEAPAVPCPTLDERDGRIWLRLELRALARALADSGPTGAEAARDALLFRARRRSLFPGTDSLEEALERHEGLAQYTGAATALEATGEGPDRVADEVRAFDDRDSYARSFAYATGPALGLLLDRWRPGWRTGFLAEPRPLGALLAEALDAPPPADLAERAETRAETYGGQEIAEQEAAREDRRERVLAAYRARLLDGPALVLRQPSLDYTFDPNAVVPLGERGTVYPTGTFRAEWGSLEVADGGALVSPDFTELRVAAPDGTAEDGAPLRGPGWTLELESGWALRRADGGWEVVRRDPAPD